MKKTVFLLLCLMTNILGINAQIGYQISLLNTATGEPRANETISVTASLSNNAGEVFYSETKSSTTNDFGVLSLSIGNEETFSNVDLSKMPFFISITANGTLIGKSQILSVPIAEIARRVVSLKKEDIVGTWYNTYSDKWYYTINNDGTISYNMASYDSGDSYKIVGEYYITGELVVVNWKSKSDTYSSMLSDHDILPIINGVLIGAYIRGEDEQYDGPVYKLYKKK